MPGFLAGWLQGASAPRDQHRVVAGSPISGRGTAAIQTVTEIALLVALCFFVAGDPPPAINEAHYLIKAKNFWDPEWLSHDAFVASGKAHLTFYATIGYATEWFSLTTSAWIGRFIGWTLLAAGLCHLSRQLFRRRWMSLVIAPVWMAGIEYGNLAGEWVIGGIEAKVIAYGFVLLALGEMVSARWGATWVLLGIASAFHVLVGGWSVAAAMVVRVATDQRVGANIRRRGYGARWYGGLSGPRVRTPLALEAVCLGIGGAISLAGLIPSLALGRGASDMEQAIAAQIYTYGRLTHHLAPGSFPWTWFARHGAWVGGTAMAWWYLRNHLSASPRRRMRPLGVFTAVAVGLALCGLVLGALPAVSPSLAARLLRFYWFRMTDAFVPLAAGVATAGWILVAVKARHWPLGSVAACAIATACVVALAVPMPERFTTWIPETVRENQPRVTETGEPFSTADAYRDWLKVCTWAGSQTPRDAVFLTPRHQHTFKWYAGRAEVVNWKDVPQDAKSLLDWARRINRAFPQILSRRHPPIDRDSLSALARDYGAGYLLVDRRILREPPKLERLYPRNGSDNATYAVYALPSSASPPPPAP